MKAKSSPLLTFCVYPENKSLYAVVNIWPTKKAMYDHVSLSRNYAALCKGVRVIGSNGRLKGQFAELNFHQRDLSQEVVSHEFTHAAFCWAERRKIDLNQAFSDQNWKTGRKRESSMPIDGVEERFCYATGRMCDQFVGRCYRVKLLGAK